MLPPANPQPAADVTVAVATLDRPEALARCLDSLAEGLVLPAEVVVVDQSGQGRTRAIVEERFSRLPLRYFHEPGRGLGLAQNAAFAHARSPLVAVTDDDCVPAADWVATLAAAFNKSDQLDVLTGRILPHGPPQPDLYPVASRTSDRPAVFHRQAMPWDIGSGNNFALRREWVWRIGGLDGRLGPGSPGQGGVDMDLFFRLLRAGARMRYEPRLLVYHAQTNRAGRLARRWPYGYGMGACCSLWLRRRDPQALRVLASWLVMRSRRLLGGAWRRQGLLVREELLVLWGTLGGLLYGLRVREAQGLRR
jgi:GT2 family glycosyltransferase